MSTHFTSKHLSAISIPYLCCLLITETGSISHIWWDNEHYLVLPLLDGQQNWTLSGIQGRRTSSIRWYTLILWVEGSILIAPQSKRFLSPLLSERQFFSLPSYPACFNPVSIPRALLQYRRSRLALVNGPFLSALNPYFGNLVKCKTFVIKMSYQQKKHFHIKGFALSVVSSRGTGQYGNSLFNNKMNRFSLRIVQEHAWFATRKVVFIPSLNS